MEDNKDRQVHKEDAADVYADAKTRLVERTRKPYTGFITDEELRQDKIIDLEEFRESRKYDTLEMKSTRVYRGFIGDDEDEDKAKPAPKKRRTLVISDSSKFKRLIAVLALFALLLVFDISYFAMKAGTGSLPDKTAARRAETISVESEIQSIEAEADGYGDYDDVKELKESWERLRDNLTGTGTGSE